MLPKGGIWFLLCKEGDYIGIFNYYEILGVPYDAATEEIVAAYYEKTQKGSSLMQDKYNTAYYILTDKRKRSKYDRAIGMHKYKKVPAIAKIMKAAARVMLTLLDAFFSFYWCFLFVILAYSVAVILYENNQLSFSLIYEYVSDHCLKASVMISVAVVDALLHFHIRRLNRFLKHYKWEMR